MRAVTAFATVKGRRKHIEDVGFMDSQNALIGVCDGMGGHERGAEAAQLCADAMVCDADTKSLIYRAKCANAIVRKLAYVDRRPGTTLAAAQCVYTFTGAPPQIDVIWAGDSRVWAFDGYSLKQVTNDHSRGGHTIYEAVGLSETPAFDGGTLAFEDEAVILATTDGAHGAICQVDMAAIIRKNRDHMKRVPRLILSEIEDTCEDNATVAIMHVRR